ncbi:hypothetical protein [Enterobacter hormaechei]|uniref:hypothetical protein n=1 Tax=Enterobacter hormaechei TaxID=158836 RepID=UPI003906BD27
MIESCKILSATIALKQDHMTNEYLVSQHEFISGIPKGEKRTVMVTFGLHARPGVPVGVYTAINPVGINSEITQTQFAENFYNTLNANLLPDGMGVFLITLEVKDVLFDQDGLYKVDVRVFPSDEMPTLDNQIDAIECFFYVLTLKEDRNVTS